MRFQSAVIFLIGLAASTLALDLSHANGQTPVDPRIFNFLNDFYSQVIYQPLNHIVTNVALLGAQVLAGISQTGIPAPGGARNFHPTEVELRGFFDDLWANSLKPQIEGALSGVALIAAQALANLGVNGVNLGKRDLTEVEMRGFFDELWNNAVRPPIENAISGLALMAAQVLAGIGVNGVDLGKRDLSEAELRGFFDELWNNAIRPPVENALSGLALMTAQLLAGIGVNGVDLGKRDLSEAELRGFFDELWNNAIRPPVENALSGLALMTAQLLAGIGVNGVDLGKRDLSGAELRGFFDELWNNAIRPPVENALSGAALMLAQVLAGVGVNGVSLG